ncbi:autoinducer 2 (AI-2) kinase [Scopulibacillus darangshiensis]|uniref:Autoinducer 2 (AI-2) kinase n=1 Tax=Scopulibacillus darangshiensis TaxID=442528 RepID=A0A4R2P447_9BACL|nr:autoinducer-2 kinase [Scopulibacillus darangshiensis]TCP29570.1 autoinducer 2 (AI-2) kinase [Scopulibacillus darangshiensis]
MDYILAFDAGTGSVRGVLYDTGGKQVACSQYEWEHRPDPAYPGSMDFDYVRNWEIIKLCISEILRQSNLQADGIKAISATSMREGFVLYDDKGNEIWACANVDARAFEEVMLLKQKDPELEQKIYNLSGQTFALGALPRLLWLKRNKPVLYEKAASITMLNDWILYKLTGELQVDPSNGCTTGIFHLQERNWRSTIMDLCGIKDSLLPPVNEAGVMLGSVTAEAARQTGLYVGIPVVSGGGDAQLASVGAGSISEGQVFVCGGSFWQQEVNVGKPAIDAQCRIRINCHAVKDLWQVETISFFPGLVMRWFRDAFCAEEKIEATRTGRDAYAILEEKAKDVPIGSHGIIPIFSDVMNYISWRHASPSFLNLSLEPQKCGKKEIFRSIQENAAFTTLGNLKLIEEATGYFPEEVIFAGGAAKGELWSQTLSDVLGVPVKIPVEKEAAALGTAIMAGVGVGLFKNINEGIKKAVKWERLHQPNMENHEAYKGYYEKWRTVYKKQLELSDAGLTEHMWKAPGL